MRTTTNFNLSVPELQDTIQSNVVAIGQNFEALDGIITPQTQATQMQSEIDQLYAQIPTATAEGDFIHVEDSSNLPPKDFKLKGNQNGTVTGDNTLTLLGKNFMTRSANAYISGRGITFNYYANTNKVTITGTVSNTYYQVSMGKTLITKADGHQSSVAFNTPMIEFNDNSDHIISFPNATGGLASMRIYTSNTSWVSVSSGIAIIPAGQNIYGIGFLFNPNTTHNHSYNIQIEAGTTATTYEPYTEQTQLISLGDTQLASTDEIAKVTNEWCINDTPITDTTLIEQLENVLKMHTNKNVTNAWIEPTGTNAQASLTLTYYKDLETIIDKIDNLEARVSLLE